MPVRPEARVSIEDILAAKDERGNRTLKNKTHPGTWKSFERMVAEDFGSTRTPLSGMVKTLTNSDTLHHKIYVECKLRGSDTDFNFWDRLNAMRKLHSGYLVSLCLENTGIGGTIWLMQRQDFFELIQKGLTKAKQVVPVRQYKAVDGLYQQTVARAEIEGKLPIIAIKKKGRKGYILGFDPGHFDSFQNILKKKN